MAETFLGVPVVDEVWVDGRRIPIICRRDYAQAKLDYARSLAKSLGKRIIMENGVLVEGATITKELELVLAARGNGD